MSEIKQDQVKTNETKSKELEQAELRKVQGAGVPRGGVTTDQADQRDQPPWITRDGRRLPTRS